ncbi:TolC family protein [Geothrix alkalitolerans]|uniref:TolC family protein n=1 Tax=Geothrix alkalitolerans TaxID=2922724 RepID=UPI001FAF4E77|nr:TolC family protein [Geothrix alkalitolerans]
MNIKAITGLSLALLSGGSLLGQEGLTVADSIRKAWRDQGGLRAGQAMVESRQAEAEGYRDLRLPSLTLQAQGVRTNEPMMAFGIKLNQARITMADFNPDSLNHPDAIGAYGGSAVLQQPLYTGGRITAARRAGDLMAQAEAASQERRKQETAQAVVEAYFGTQVAEQALKWVEDSRTWIQGMEDFVGARVRQGLMLESELQRLKAFHAQIDAQKAEVVKQVHSARSGLGLLTGTGPVEGPLATPLTPDFEGGMRPSKEPTDPAADLPSGRRGDLLAADLQARAATEGAKAAKGSLLPEVGLELGAGTLHHSWSEKGNWTWAGVGVKWKVFSAPDQAKARAARAQERAARDMRDFKQKQAEHEIRVAKESVLAAQARYAAAKESLAAAEESKRLREARHKEGLAPLIEVLDAEAAVQGAHTLILQSLFDLRVSRASLDLATGTPIEGVKP